MRVPGAVKRNLLNDGGKKYGLGEADFKKGIKTIDAKLGRVSFVRKNGQEAELKEGTKRAVLMNLMGQG